MTATAAKVQTSGDALSFYEENGYWIEPNLLTGAECDALIEAAQNLQHFKDGSTKPCLQPHRECPTILNAMKNKRTIALLEQMLGGKVDALQSQMFYGKPGTPGFSVHQDNFFVEAPYGAFASVWIALMDTDPGNGGLTAYPGSHKEGMLPVRKLEGNKDERQDPNAANEETVVPPQYERLSLTVPKGAGVFIHGHIAHGSHANTSKDRWRYVLLNTYIRHGEPFRAGHYARREPVSMYD